MPRPNTAIRSRCTSFTPPPNVRMIRPRYECSSRDWSTAPGVSVLEVRLLAEDLHQEPERLEVELGAEHLRRRRVGRLECALGRRRRDLPVDQAQELEPGVHPGQVELHPLLVDHTLSRRASSSSCAQRRTSFQRALDDPRRAQRDALVVELVGDEPPALVLLADAGRRRDAHVLVEHLVDVRTRPSR